MTKSGNTQTPTLAKSSGGEYSQKPKSSTDSVKSEGNEKPSAPNSESSALGELALSKFPDKKPAEQAKITTSNPTAEKVVATEDYEWIIPDRYAAYKGDKQVVAIALNVVMDNNYNRKVYNLVDVLTSAGMQTSYEAYRINSLNVEIATNYNYHTGIRMALIYNEDPYNRSNYTTEGDETVPFVGSSEVNARNHSAFFGDANTGLLCSIPMPKRTYYMRTNGDERYSTPGILELSTFINRPKEFRSELMLKMTAQVELLCATLIIGPALNFTRFDSLGSVFVTIELIENRWYMVLERVAGKLWIVLDLPNTIKLTIESAGATYTETQRVMTMGFIRPGTTASRNQCIIPLELNGYLDDSAVLKSSDAGSWSRSGYSYEWGEEYI